MPVTVSASTVSQARAIVITCVATLLVLYTFSGISHLTPTPGSSIVEHRPPTDTLAPSRPVEQAGSKPGDEVGHRSEEVPISEDLIPHGVSVFMPDNFVKHLVVPRMSSEDVTWLTYLSEDLNIITKTYLIDSDKSNTPPGTLTVPINKVNPALPHVPIPWRLTKLQGSRGAGISNLHNRLLRWPPRYRNLHTRALDSLAQQRPAAILNPRDASGAKLPACHGARIHEPPLPLEPRLSGLDKTQHDRIRRL